MGRQLGNNRYSEETGWAIGVPRWDLGCDLAHLEAIQISFDKQSEI